MELLCVVRRPTRAWAVVPSGDDEAVVYSGTLAQEMRCRFGRLPVAVNKDLKLSCVFARLCCRADRNRL